MCFRLAWTISFQQAGELQRRPYIPRVKGHSLPKGDLSCLAIPQAKAQIGHEAKGFLSDGKGGLHHLDSVFDVSFGRLLPAVFEMLSEPNIHVIMPPL